MNLLRMRYETPEISWHNTQPVYSINFQPNNSNDDVQRIATAGGDSIVRLWRVWLHEFTTKLEFLSCLVRHARSVNVAKFSPNGSQIASGGDDQVILLWQKDAHLASGDLFAAEEEKLNKETWRVFRTLRGHLEDINDLSWSSDSLCLVSASVDNTCLVWNIETGQSTHILKEAKGFVQGVSCDPLGHYLASLSNDRSCRIYNTKTYRCCFNNQKFNQPLNLSPVKELKGDSKMFIESSSSFFKRLSFSPSGELLAVPCGVVHDPHTHSQRNVTYIYTRSNLNKPVIYLPHGQKPSIAVSFNPNKYKLRTNENTQPLFKLSYRLIYAVLTEDSIFFYDTQQTTPFAHLTNLHYAPLNSGSWSPLGDIFIVCSSDGYVTLITFDRHELGEIYPNPDSCKTNTSDEVVKLCEPLNGVTVDVPSTIPDLIITKLKTPENTKSPVFQSVEKKSEKSKSVSKRRVNITTISSSNQNGSGQSSLTKKSEFTPKNTLTTPKNSTSSSPFTTPLNTSASSDLRLTSPLLTSLSDSAKRITSTSDSKSKVESVSFTPKQIFSPNSCFNTSSLKTAKRQLSLTPDIKQSTNGQKKRRVAFVTISP